MRTGNAILTAMFLWMCYEIPKNIWTISQAYDVSEFAGLNVETWFTIAFIIPLICAIVALITGAEKKQIKIRTKKEVVDSPEIVKEEPEELVVQPVTPITSKKEETPIVVKPDWKIAEIEKIVDKKLSDNDEETVN